MNRDKITRALNRLLEANVESEKMFRTAVEDAEYDDLRQPLSDYRQQHADFVTALQQLIRQQNGEPTEEDGATASVERGWLTIKSAMTIEQDRTDQVILAECAAQEGEMLELYQEVLQREWPPSLADELQAQQREIAAAHERLNHLAETAVADSKE